MTPESIADGSGRLTTLLVILLSLFPSSGLQSEAEDVIGDKRPDGGGDDPDEEKDEQQRLPNVAAAAFLGEGRCSSCSQC